MFTFREKYHKIKLSKIYKSINNNIQWKGMLYGLLILVNFFAELNCSIGGGNYYETVVN